VGKGGSKCVKEGKIETEKTKPRGFNTILIGVLTNVMAYAWHIGIALGLEVLHAGGRKGSKGYAITTYSKMYNPSLLAA